MATSKTIKFKGVPTKLGTKAEVPVSFELTVTRTKPAGKNAVKVNIGGEDFFIEPGKTVLQLR